MKRAQIFLIDLDERYLMPLEKKFVEVLGDNADINVITDKQYLEEYFSVPRNIDLLIISENLFNQSFERHEISNIFILTESEDTRQFESTSNLTLSHIYKYTSVKEIYSRVSAAVSQIISTGESHKGQSKIITVYSPVGGIGKTTISFALCNELTKLNQNVLYVGTDSIQSFGYFFHNDTYLEVEKQMVSKNEYISEAVKPYLIHKNFDILPPFFKALSSSGITEEHYLFLLQNLKQKEGYDFIVVDTESAFTKEKSSMLAYSDYVLFALGQDELSVNKFDCLLSAIDCSDTEKFIFICNKYLPDKQSAISGKYKISEYIEYNEKVSAAGFNNLFNIKSFEKLAFLFV